MVALPRMLNALVAASASWPWFHATNCDIHDKVSSLVLPPNQSTLAIPANVSLSFVGLGFGVQNYTCTPDNNFTNVGAVAELIDVSCLAGSSIFPALPDLIYNAWNDDSNDSIQSIIDDLHQKNPPEVLAQHFFVPFGSGISPKWDFTSSGKFEGQEDAFVLAKVQGSVPAPTDPSKDVAWVELVNVQGAAADFVFRTDTRGGQPPSSCTGSQNISVKYVSYYWFFGGSLLH